MPLLLFILVAILPLHAEAGEIIWGKEVKPHSWPFMAFVTDSDSALRKHHCGGFLVAEDIVMTAAHCKRSELNVILGAHNIKKEENNTQVIPVLKAVSHPDYNKKTKVNDIMLLKLKSKANIDGFVKTIALPKSQDWVKPGQLCRVAGWGRLANCIPSDTLQEVTLQVQKEQTCQKMFKYYHKSTQLCVGNPKEYKATNQGDSGGPFVCDSVAQGIVSYGPHTKVLPVVFTRISSFLPWIKKTMKLLENPYKDSCVLGRYPAQWETAE